MTISKELRDRCYGESLDKTLDILGIEVELPVLDVAWEVTPHACCAIRTKGSHNKVAYTDNSRYADVIAKLPDIYNVVRIILKNRKRGCKISNADLDCLVRKWADIREALNDN